MQATCWVVAVRRTGGDEPPPLRDAREFRGQHGAGRHIGCSVHNLQAGCIVASQQPFARLGVAGDTSIEPLLADTVVLPTPAALAKLRLRPGGSL